MTRSGGELVIIGAGGFGREVHAYAGDCLAGPPAWRVAGFADDDPAAASRALPAPLLGPVRAVPPAAGRWFVVAVGDPALRRRIAEDVAGRGGRLLTLVHPSAYVAPDARLGPGCVVCPFAFVGVGAVVGANALVNAYASVHHDARVGDNCVFSPYATVTGGVHLGDDVFLGTHATVTPRRRVGRGAKISAGAAVFRDVPAHAVVAGNPAEPRAGRRPCPTRAAEAAPAARSGS